MTVKKRLWFWLGLALAVIPEILWSPVGNYLYEFWTNHLSGNSLPFRDNWLLVPMNINYFSFVLLVQSIGLLIATTAWVLACPKSGQKILVGSIGYGLSLIVLFLFGLSVSLRSIGL